MTCIVAVTDDLYGAAIGGDACTSDDWDHARTISDPKVFEVGDALVGVSGDWRLTHALRYAFEPPPHPEGRPDHAYMLLSWVSQLRATLRLVGALQTKYGVEEIADGGRALVVYRGRIYEVGSNLQVVSYDGYGAIGSGYAVALGALHATRDLDAYDGSAAVRNRVRIALEAAAEHTTTVRGPFTVVEQATVPRVGGYRLTFPSPEPGAQDDPRDGG